MNQLLTICHSFAKEQQMFIFKISYIFQFPFFAVLIFYLFINLVQSNSNRVYVTKIFICF